MINLIISLSNIRPFRFDFSSASLWMARELGMRMEKKIKYNQRFNAEPTLNDHYNACLPFATQTDEQSNQPQPWPTSNIRLLNVKRANPMYPIQPDTLGQAAIIPLLFLGIFLNISL